MPEYDVFYTEEPIKSIWNRLGYLSSVEMAWKFLAEHPPTDPNDQTRERAKSLAFAIRSAREYFHPEPDFNLTESCLSYYYGLFSLLQALIIAVPSPPHQLAQIEEETRNGHGVQNFFDDSSAFPESAIVYFTGHGFAKVYGEAKKLGLERLCIAQIVFGQNGRKLSERSRASWS